MAFSLFWPPWEWQEVEANYLTYYGNMLEKCNSNCLNVRPAFISMPKDMKAEANGKLS